MVNVVFSLGWCGWFPRVGEIATVTRRNLLEAAFVSVVVSVRPLLASLMLAPSTAGFTLFGASVRNPPS